MAGRAWQRLRGQRASSLPGPCVLGRGPAANRASLGKRRRRRSAGTVCCWKTVGNAPLSLPTPSCFLHPPPRVSPLSSLSLGSPELLGEETVNCRCSAVQCVPLASFVSQSGGHVESWLVHDRRKEGRVAVEKSPKRQTARGRGSSLFSPPSTMPWLCLAGTLEPCRLVFPPVLSPRQTARV